MRAEELCPISNSIEIACKPNKIKEHPLYRWLKHKAGESRYVEKVYGPMVLLCGGEIQFKGYGDSLVKYFFTYSDAGHVTFNYEAKGDLAEILMEYVNKKIVECGTVVKKKKVSGSRYSGEEAIFDSLGVPLERTARMQLRKKEIKKLS